MDTQAGPNHRLPDITLLDVMTFIALALQMENDLRDALHDYWSRLLTPAHYSDLWRDYDMKPIFTHTVFFAFCRLFTET